MGNFRSWSKCPWNEIWASCLGFVLYHDFFEWMVLISFRPRTWCAALPQNQDSRPVDYEVEPSKLRQLLCLCFSWLSPIFCYSDGNLINTVLKNNLQDSEANTIFHKMNYQYHLPIIFFTNQTSLSFTSKFVLIDEKYCWVFQEFKESKCLHLYYFSCESKILAHRKRFPRQVLGKHAYLLRIITYGSQTSDFRSTPLLFQNMSFLIFKRFVE